MDFGKIEPVFGESNSFFNETMGLVFAKAYISAGFLGYAQNYEL